MAVGKEIRGKIKSVENTKKITKAMEMVAASKMRKAQDRMRAARPYSDKIRNITANLSQAHPEYQSPYMRATGTAKAVVQSLNRLTGDDTFNVETDIDMIRSDEGSLEFGVLPEHLRGHAFHTYTLTSPDKSVEFVLKHNVSGRRIYAEGTADAVLFLAKKLKTENVGRVYNMIDVLEEGAM